MKIPGCAGDLFISKLGRGAAGPSPLAPRPQPLAPAVHGQPLPPDEQSGERPTIEIPSVATRDSSTPT